MAGGTPTAVESVVAADLASQASIKPSGNAPVVGGISGVSSLAEVLGSASGSVTAATRILNDGAIRRNVCEVINTDAAQTLYVAPWSGVTATHWKWKLTPGQTTGEFDCGINVPIYVFATIACTYSAWHGRKAVM